MIYHKISRRMADRNVGLHLTAQQQVKVEKPEEESLLEREAQTPAGLKMGHGLMAAIMQLLAFLGL